MLLSLEEDPTLDVAEVLALPTLDSLLTADLEEPAADLELAATVLFTILSLYLLFAEVAFLCLTVLDEEPLFTMTT